MGQPATILDELDAVALWLKDVAQPKQSQQRTPITKEHVHVSLVRMHVLRKGHQLGVASENYWVKTPDVQRARNHRLISIPREQENSIVAGMGSHKLSHATGIGSGERKGNHRRASK